MSEKGAQEEGRLSLADRRVFAVLIAVLLLSIAMIGYVVATSSSYNSEKLPVVEVGDTVYVTYVGFFEPNPGGWLFDTNDIRKAHNESVPKSLYFVLRDDKEYTPLNFTAGISQDFLKPFVDGVVGMKVTQPKLLFIPKEEAYPVQADYIGSYPLVQTMPVIQNISVDDFERAYHQAPSIGLVVQHYFWEWNVVVMSVAGDNTIVQNEPVTGQLISQYGDPEEDPRYGWYAKIESVDPSANGGIGLIKIKNLISSQDNYHLKGTDFDKRTFTLIDVNETAQIFVIHYNGQNYVGEIAGRNLYFEITITRVEKA